MDFVTWFLEKVMEYMSEPYQSWDSFVYAVSEGVRQFTTSEGKFYWVFVGSSLILGIGCYVFETRRGRVGEGGSLMSFLSPRKVYGHPSALVDYKFVAIDLTIRALTYGPIISGMSIVCYKAGRYVSEATWSGFPPSLQADPIIVALIAVLVMDLGYYIGHYLAHKIPLLWIFHQVHHSAEVLTPITTHRFHPVDTMLGALPVSVISALFAIGYTQSDEAVAVETILGLNMFIFAFYICGYHLRHSHIWLSYGPIASWVFMSPAQHQIHHSKDPKHWNKNFGYIFSIWDTLFKSCYVPREKESLQLGIPGADAKDYSTVSKLYFLPFVKAGRYILGKREPMVTTIEGRPESPPQTTAT